VIGTKVDAFNKTISEGSVLDQRMFEVNILSHESQKIRQQFCMSLQRQVVAVDKSPCSSRFAHREFFLAHNGDCGVWPKTGRRVGVHECDLAVLL